MTESAQQRLQCDYLIIGSGLAGLKAALEAAKHGSVLVVTKSSAEECNTRYAQGGIACVIDGDDTFDAHIADTITAGAGLCHPDVVRDIVRAAPARIRDLEGYGMEFTRRGEVRETSNSDQAREFDLGREGGHSARRILHAGDITGRQVSDVLLARCRENPRITILEHHLAIDLITWRHFEWKGPNRCYGAYVMDTQTHHIKTILGRFTLLATGGAGKVYLCTCNPDVASGDGVAMAWRASAEIANMEFYQFHPTILYHPQAKSFLISEAVRGEGAILKIRRGGEYVEFMHRYHPLKSLAPRDIVARAIDNELKRSGEECAWLDIRHKSEEFLRKRFPNIFQECLKFGINMATDLIPIVPAAHYCCGGVRTDVNGVTNIRDLYAIGECGCTGLHGANRLASNSLLEAMVVGYNAVQHTLTRQDNNDHLPPANVPDWKHGDAVNSDEMIVITHNWDEIRRFMWDYVGIVRTHKRLERAKHRIRMLRREIETYYWDFTVTPDLIELRNLASVAEMIIDSAIARRESIGLHYNLDCPKFDASYHPQDTIIQRPVKPNIWFE
ncbi:MAG: L-aspartate oxidase [Victivallales bacterium]|nr:L-aspartate oxidase [Victivallales bacterium]